MFPQILIKHNIGNTIQVPNQLDIRATTYTTDTLQPGVTTVPAINGSEFSAGSPILLLLSEMGAQNSEIVGSSSHTETAFTTSPTLQVHNRGEIISEMHFDQIQIFKSPTLFGSYVLLVTESFQVTQLNTVVFDSAGLTTDFYKVQWKNSLTGQVSTFSTAISVLTYPEDSAGAMFSSVTNLMGISENDKIINAKFLVDALNDARQYGKSVLEGIRHPWQQKFEFPIKILAGSNYVPLPDDIEYDETDQSLLAARFLTNNILVPFNLMKIDKRTWNQVAFYSTGGITNTDAAIGATSLSLNSVGDFPPQGGSAQVATTDYTQTVIEITYTSIDYNTNQLLGVLGVTRAIPSGTQVWSRTAVSQPIYYGVWDGKLWFSAIIPQSMQGTNVYVDYYKRMERINNFYDSIPEKYREMYKPYLRWAIKYRKDITTPSDDPDLVKFEGLVKALFDNLYTGQDSTIITS